MDLHILYRISDGGYKKNKLSFATKEKCLDNAIQIFGKEKLIVFADNCGESTSAMIASKELKVIPTSIGSSGQSWKYVCNYALQHFENKDVVYFLEDDYLHTSDASLILLEGLAVADYVTLYDHLDKYINGTEGGNPYVRGGGELSRVLVTKHTHWKTTNSTTMTFATKVSTLKADFSVWDKYTKGSHPMDFDIFKELQSRGSLYNRLFGRKRRLISPLPGRSTHVEQEWLSPLIDWSSI